MAEGAQIKDINSAAAGSIKVLNEVDAESIKTINSSTAGFDFEDETVNLNSIDYFTGSSGNMTFGTITSGGSRTGIYRSAGGQNFFNAIRTVVEIPSASCANEAYIQWKHSDPTDCVYQMGLSYFASASANPTPTPAGTPSACLQTGIFNYTRLGTDIYRVCPDNDDANCNGNHSGGGTLTWGAGDMYRIYITENNPILQQSTNDGETWTTIRDCAATEGFYPLDIENNSNLVAVFSVYEYTGDQVGSPMWEDIQMYGSHGLISGSL